MKIALRKLAVTDLSTKYARNMGDGKIRHYRVPYTETMLGDNALKMVKDIIMREENFEGSEVEFAEEAIASLVAPSTDGSLKIEDVSHILENDKEVEKSLRKFASKNLIHQTVTISRKDRIINVIARLLNPVIGRINALLQDIQRLDLEDICNGKGFFFRSISKRYPEYNMHFVRFLSVGFEGCDFQQAKNSLLQDLRILKDNGLILGHLAMPSLMPLADTVGSNESPYLLFCFPVVDSTKLRELIGKENADSRQPLKHLSIVNETLEGSINYLNGISPEQKYQIETIDVVTEKHEVKQEQVVASFEASLPKVSEAASVTRALLKTYPEELAKARAELEVAVTSAHDKALTAARKKVAKTISKKKTTKKPVKRKKVTKKPTKKKISTKKPKKK